MNRGGKERASLPSLKTFVIRQLVKLVYTFHFTEIVETRAKVVVTVNVVVTLVCVSILMSYTFKVARWSFIITVAVVTSAA